MRMFKKLPIVIAVGFRSLAAGEQNSDTCDNESYECECVEFVNQDKPRFAFPSCFYRYHYDEYLLDKQPEATWPTKNTDAFYDAFTR